jgi:hypothetical protein
MAEKQVSVRIKAEGGGQLKAEFQSIGSEAQKTFGKIDQGARRSGAGLQNVGYQVQDFAVQVAGGTDVSRALAQQLPQLLSGMGLVGVLFGTVAAVAVPLFAAFGMGADKAEELAKSIKEMDEATRAYDQAAQLAIEPIEALRKKYGDLAEAVQRARIEQAEMARSRAVAAVDQTLSATGFGAGNNEALAAYSAMQQDFRAPSQALQAMADAAGDVEFKLSEIARQYGLSTAEAYRLATATEAVRNSASGTAQEQANAANTLLDVLVQVFGSAEAANEATGGLVDRLLESVQAAGEIARIDMASPITAAASEASRLADNLFDALAAQRQFDRDNKAYGGRGGDPRQYMPGGAKPFNPSREIIEQADALLNPRPRRGGGGGGGGGVSEADREAKRIYDQTRTAAEKYAIELERLNDLHAAGKLDTDTYTRALEKLGKDLDKTGDLGKKAASAIRGAFDNLFDDPAAALRDLSKQLFQMALYAQLAKSMPSVFGSNGIIPLMNANGNVFEGGSVQAFAAGGVVTSATMFPMKGGAGVMGEAGPEAIMPLTRIGGKLGVAAAGAGGGGVKVEVNNYSGEAVTRTEARGPNGEKIIRLAVGKDIASGNHDAALRSRFGTRPNPVRR